MKVHPAIQREPELDSSDARKNHQSGSSPRPYIRIPNPEPKSLEGPLSAGGSPGFSGHLRLTRCLVLSVGFSQPVQLSDAARRARQKPGPTGLEWPLRTRRSPRVGLRWAANRPRCCLGPPALAILKLGGVPAPGSAWGSPPVLPLVTGRLVRRRVRGSYNHREAKYPGAWQSGRMRWS